MKYYTIIIFTLTFFYIQCYHHALSSAPPPSYASSGGEGLSTENIKGLDKAKEKISKWARKVKKYVHSTTLDEVASNMIPSLKLLLGNSIDIEDLYFESNNGKKHLNMTGGNLTRLHTLYEMRSRHAQPNKKEIEFELRLAFRNLILRYNLNYTSERLLFTRRKSGFVVLHQKGLTLVTVGASVPKNVKSILRDTKRSNDCYLTVKKVDVTTPNSLIRVLKMVHDPFRMAGSSVKTMLRSMMEEIKRVVSKGLQSKIKWAVSNLNNVCSIGDMVEDTPFQETGEDHKILFKPSQQTEEDQQIPPTLSQQTSKDQQTSPIPSPQTEEDQHISPTLSQQTIKVQQISPIPLQQTGEDKSISPTLPQQTQKVQNTLSTPSQQNGEDQPISPVISSTPSQKD